MKSPQRFARRRVRGMSLIEVLVAMMVMTVGILGLMTMMARASQASMTSDDTQRASLLVNELATQMWLINSTAVPAATVSAWQARVADATAQGLPGGVGTVTINSNSSARITITWMPPQAKDASERRQSYTDVQLNG